MPIIEPAQRIGKVQEYYFSRKLKEIALLNEAGHRVLNLGIGSPDQAPPAEAVEALVQESRSPNAHGYQSYVGLPQLRRAFADWYLRYYGVRLDPAKEILPLMGSKEGIMHIAMTYLEAGDEALVPNPGYPSYRATALLAGASVREYPLLEDKGWLPDLDTLSKEDLSKVKIMWVNYPNMPTGANAPKGFFAELVAFAKEKNLLVCNDNPYSFILNDNPRSILAVEGAMDVALELNSLSKAHNMAGWRVGMLAGAEAYLSEIIKFKSNMDSGMFRAVQLAAVEALRQPDAWYASVNATYRKRRERVFQIMYLLGCRYDRQQTGLFVWAKIPDRYASGFEVSDLVLQRAFVFITPGGIFGSKGERFIRISLCADESVFIEAIERMEKSLAVV